MKCAHDDIEGCPYAIPDCACTGLVASSQTATPEPLTPGREWGVFRCDTGEQVGVGTTENHGTALEDLLAWQRDGFNVVLRVRPIGGWADV